MNKKWTLVLSSLVLVALVIGYKFYKPASNGIIDFKYARDKQDVLQLMQDNWYWLISSPDFDADFMLRERAPSNKDLTYKGKLTIKVLRKGKKLIGFVAYYKKSPHQGHLFLLSVDKKFRRKGYAEQLAKHAIDELKKMGATWIQVPTRLNNVKARTLYNKLGMEEYLQTDGFVYFRKML